MATNTWTPLWSKLVDSSIWSEPDDVRIVFVTMLAKKDSDHIVRATAFNISKWANKTEAQVLAALKVLSSPDRRRLEPQPHDGKRIEKVDDGWLMLNGEEYRKMVQDEMRKARLRRAQTVFRQKHPKGGSPDGGAAAIARAEDRQSELERDAIGAEQESDGDRELREERERAE